MSPRCIVFINSILIVSAISAQSQKLMQWNAIKAVNFLQDSIPGFQNVEVENHLIYPIQQSNADLEIRLYLFENSITTMGKIEVLRFYDDTVMAESINWRYYSWRYRDPYEFVGKDQFGQDICKRISKPKVKVPAQALIDSIKASGIFTLEDYGRFLTSVSSKKVVISDPYEGSLHFSKVYCEIKLGPKVRNFYISGNASALYIVNDSVEYYRRAPNFTELYFSIFKRY